MNVEEEILSFLEGLGVKYPLLRHEPAHTMAQCAACEQALCGLMPKNLFLTPRRRASYHLLVMRPDLEYQASVVSAQAGTSRLGFADEEALFRLLRTRPGSISPLGLMFDAEKQVRLLVDRALRQQERLLFHPCDNRASLALSGADFFEKVLPALGREPVYIDLQYK